MLDIHKKLRAVTFGGVRYAIRPASGSEADREIVGPDGAVVGRFSVRPGAWSDGRGLSREIAEAWRAACRDAGIDP